MLNSSVKILATRRRCNTAYDPYACVAAREILATEVGGAPNVSALASFMREFKHLRSVILDE